MRSNMLLWWLKLESTHLLVHAMHSPFGLVESIDFNTSAFKLPPINFGIINLHACAPNEIEFLAEYVQIK